MAFLNWRYQANLYFHRRPPWKYAQTISRQRINMTFKPNGNQSVASGAATLARARSSGRDGRIILGETTVEGPGLLLSLKTEVSCPRPGH
jgi:hypothetical protein